MLDMLDSSRLVNEGGQDRGRGSRMMEKASLNL